MGASRSPVAPPPDAVAAQFTDVYYGVASVKPERLPELFGADSELSHVPGVCVGAKDIASSALALPLAKKDRAIVSSLDAMHTANGGYVVLVTGTLEGAPFTQTFVLACAGDDESKAHFYCRNDIFRFVNIPKENAGINTVPSSTTSKGMAVEKIEHVASSGSPGIAPAALNKMKNGDAGSPASISDITSNNIGIDTPVGKEARANGGNVVGGNQGVDDGNVEGEGDDDGEEDDDDYDDEASEGAIVQNGPDGAGGAKSGAANGNLQNDTTVVSAPAVATPPANPSKPAPVNLAKEAAAPSATSAAAAKVPPREEAQAVHAAKPKVPSKSSAPKSWASIVSASSGTPAPAPVAAHGGPPATVITPSSEASEQGTTKGASPTSSLSVSAASGSQGSNVQKKEVSGGTSSFGSGTSGNHGPHSTLGSTKGETTSQPTGNSSAGGWSSVDNKRHGHNSNDGGFKTVNGHHGGYHHPKHNPGRVYGPSAVIQLSSVPGERVSKDIRALANDFSAEFAQYGQVRNVEVKVHKGLAFIEYSSSDGVRAAVAAWADGARDSGPFKGVALGVSEKRQRRHIPGGEHTRGGGRGAVRGGGRGGNGGRGRGRGMPLGGGGAGAQSSASGPTPPSS